MKHNQVVTGSTDQTSAATYFIHSSIDHERFELLLPMRGSGFGPMTRGGPSSGENPSHHLPTTGPPTSMGLLRTQRRVSSSVAVHGAHLLHPVLPCRKGVL